MASRREPKIGKSKNLRRYRRKVCCKRGVKRGKGVKSLLNRRIMLITLLEWSNVTAIQKKEIVLSF